MHSLNVKRCWRLARRSIEALRLDLTDLVVLTEAATGPYALTASLAALAGARRVYALSRESRYGTLEEARAQTMEIAEAWGIGERVEVITVRDHPGVSEADIVTNLGFVRPLDAALLERLKSTTVVTLMFETWELREEDVDLSACRRLGIPVLGTNESVPELATMSYLGPVAMRLLFECGIEVVRCRLVIIGGGAFGLALIQSLLELAAEVRQIDPFEGARLDTPETRSVIAEADALVVAEHRDRRPLLGPEGHLDGRMLATLNPGLAVVHIAGEVDQADLVAAGLTLAPQHFARAGYMSVTTAYVGARPLIDLHLGGLKVGELLARARRRGLAPTDAEAEALMHPICQAFAATPDSPSYSRLRAD